MENKSIKNILKNFFFSFFRALFVSMVFLNICGLFLLSAGGFSSAEKALILNVNLWRIVFIFGLLFVLTAGYFFIRKKEELSIPIFLFVFWILGGSFVYFVSEGNMQLNTDITSINILGFVNTFIILSLPLLFLIWLFGIYFCRKIAIKFDMKKSIAVFAGIVLPVLSMIIYSIIYYQKVPNENKLKLTKVIAGILAAILIIVSGITFYTLRSPEYSLYQLKKAIKSNDTANFNKYFNSKEVSEKIGETEAGIQETMMGMDVSILEIKEENSDQGKNAIKYIPTKLNGKSLKWASLAYFNGENGIEPEISLKFNDEGTKLLSELTQKNVGKTIAIFLNGQLASAPRVETEITNGEAVITGNFTYEQAKEMVEKINTSKDSMLDSLKITKTERRGNSAKIAIQNINGENFWIDMNQMQGGYWQIMDTRLLEFEESYIKEKLPAPDESKTITYEWKYKGKNYSLNEELYGSFYKFYNSLPATNVFNGESQIGWLEKENQLFINGVEEDDTISKLAKSIKSLGEEKKLNENQIVELVATFVQTIPYDTEKFNNRKAGLNGKAEKPTYPYEVLYDKKGVCQDKSYLAYVLLKEMGYGVSLFLFPDPEDNHMAMGVKCPKEYSNYDSGYCFLETTSLGNKIGTSPNLSKEFGIATSKIELGDFSNDLTENEYSPLGKIEVLNKVDGKEYTGIIETVNTQKEIDNLLATVRKLDGELNVSSKDLDNQDAEIGKMINKLNKLATDIDNLDEYNNILSKYKKAVSAFEKDRKAYNAKVANRNQINTRYNNLINSFYQ